MKSLRLLPTILLCFALPGIAPSVHALLPGPQKLAIYYGYPSLVNGAAGNLAAATAHFAAFDLVVLGDFDDDEARVTREDVRADRFERNFDQTPRTNDKHLPGLARHHFRLGGFRRLLRLDLGRRNLDHDLGCDRGQLVVVGVGPLKGGAAAAVAFVGGLDHVDDR